MIAGLKRCSMMYFAASTTPKNSPILMVWFPIFWFKEEFAGGQINGSVPGNSSFHRMCPVGGYSTFRAHYKPGMVGVLNPSSAILRRSLAAADLKLLITPSKFSMSVRRCNRETTPDTVLLEYELPPSGSK